MMKTYALPVRHVMDTSIHMDVRVLLIESQSQVYHSRNWMLWKNRDRNSMA